MMFKSWRLLCLLLLTVQALGLGGLVVSSDGSHPSLRQSFQITVTLRQPTKRVEDPSWHAWREHVFLLGQMQQDAIHTVSYTHLTLPTTPYV